MQKFIMTVISYDNNVKNKKRETFMTLVTNEEYCIGALVLGVSLRQVQTQKEMSVMVTKELNNEMRELLAKHFDNVIEVNPIYNTNCESLKALSRKDLDISFTKIHCWSMVQFDKVVFLDADTLVLHNIDELFEREELSAVPDPNWPDCFNAGVFVLKPNLDTFNGLLRLALCTGSFDGRDQGLLNTYFTDWLTGGISHRLAYIHNCICQISDELGFDFYTSTAAWVHFGGSIRVAHFSGPIKPWHRISSARGCSREAYLALIDAKSERRMVSRTAGMLAYWWSLFLILVRPDLTPNMYLGDFCLESPKVQYVEPTGGDQNQANTYAPYHPSFADQYSNSTRPLSPTEVGPYHPEFHETRWDYLHQGQRIDEASQFTEYHYTRPPTPEPPPTAIRTSQILPSVEISAQQRLPPPPIPRRPSQPAPPITKPYSPREHSSKRGYHHIVFTPPSPPSESKSPPPTPPPPPPPPPALSPLPSTPPQPFIPPPHSSSPHHCQKESTHSTSHFLLPLPNDSLMTSTTGGLGRSENQITRQHARLKFEPIIIQPVSPSTWKPPKPLEPPLQPKYCFDCQDCKREMAKAGSVYPDFLGKHRRETDKLSLVKKVTPKPKRATKPVARKLLAGKNSENIPASKQKEWKKTKLCHLEGGGNVATKLIPSEEPVISPTFQPVQSAPKSLSQQLTGIPYSKPNANRMTMSQSASLLNGAQINDSQLLEFKTEFRRQSRSVEAISIEGKGPKMKPELNPGLSAKKRQSNLSRRVIEPSLVPLENVAAISSQSSDFVPTTASRQTHRLAGIQLKSTSDFARGKIEVLATEKTNITPVAERESFSQKVITSEVSEELVNAVAKKHKNRTWADIRRVKEKLKEKGFDKEVHESNWENKKEVDEMRRVLLSVRLKAQPGTAGHLARIDLSGKLCARHERMETERMYAWERGDIDYTGTDRFANILAKLCDTMTRVGGESNLPIGLDV
ncbi:Glycogenin-1 [Fasciola hepatica]|uniref:glycogenin glucosyltransferase n=1 Tax=Fasciola hepatica TaxID=6192 RepID=A0A4E0R083_FASHE|nr:Glycogenin-1 [Fasciola hepatica]